MNKRLFGTLLSMSTLALLLTATPVFAAVEVDTDGANEETGADSDNDNIFIVKDEGNDTVANSGNVANEAHAKANTGKNDQNMNTTGGDLTSGDVDASTDWTSVVNDGFGLCGCPFGGDDTDVKADFMNKLTGYDSDNLNLLVVKDEGDTTVGNVADILNHLGLYANTGYNDQNMNTTAGDLETGDVNVDAAIANWANSADGDSHGDDGISVDVDASNEKTGAESDNTNKVIVKNEGDTTLSNVANLNNSVRVKANTGGNDQNKNTTAGDLKTGDVSVETDIYNEANTGSCCISGGDTSVKADLSNDTTGYNSDNTNKVIVKDEGDKTVSNVANVTNEVEVHADTGKNDQEQNTTGGDVESGSVSIDFGSTSVVNSVD